MLHCIQVTSSSYMQCVCIITYYIFTLHHFKQNPKFCLQSAWKNYSFAVLPLIISRPNQRYDQVAEHTDTLLKSLKKDMLNDHAYILSMLRKNLWNESQHRNATSISCRYCEICKWTWSKESSRNRVKNFVSISVC